MMRLNFIICAVFLLLCVCKLKAQVSIYVAPSATGNGSSWQNPSNLQDALLNAAADDIIKLKQGVYSINTTLVIERTLHIYGGYSGSGDTNNPELYKSILDGGSQSSLIYMKYGSKESIIKGIYFENGFGSSLAGALSVEGSKIQIRNCVFRNNTSQSSIGSGAIFIRADDVQIFNTRFEGNKVISSANEDHVTGGGAIHIRFNANTLIKNCKFINNTSHYPGGAISSWGPNSKIEHSSFNNNRSQTKGGAIYKNFDDLSVENSVFTGNAAGKSGGAIYNNNDALKVKSTVFKNNIAQEDGGGIYIKAAEVTLSKVIFQANQATLKGGAIYTNLAEAGIVDALFRNNSAAAGGGAVYNGGQMALSNIDFISNTHTAFFVSSDSSTKIFNSIFYNNTALQSQIAANADIEVQDGGSPIYLTLEITRNILQQLPKYGTLQNNLIGVDPLFIDAGSGNFNLQHSSQAVDRGRSMLYNSVSLLNAGASLDLAGDHRFTGVNIDLGAYEYSSLLNCTALKNPLNNAVDVPLNSTIQWDASATATGYRISIGTSSGGTDIVNNKDLGNVTSYTPVADFPEDATIYVRIIPYNKAGDATGCSEEHFTTEKLINIPECTQLITPLNNATDVPISSTIQWDAVATATGYRISIGTSSGGTDIVNNKDLGNVTSYTPVADFQEDATIYVRIIPYNKAGDATGCSEEHFTTEKLIDIPQCTQLITPLNNATDVPISSAIQWDAVATATGYRISIGTSSGGTDIVNSKDIGNVTSYTPVAHFPEDATIYVRIIPYNKAGDATGCSEEHFSTEKLIDIPGCTQLITPLNNATDVPISSTIQWDAVATATGYRISIGTSSGGTGIVNSKDLGNVTSYTPVADFPEGATIYVRIIAYNEAGDATGCSEEHFTTEKLIDIPGCAQLISPLNNATDVALETKLQWTGVPTATGYRISIGTSSGGTDIVNGKDLGNVTSYTPVADFPEGATIYVRIIAYNEAGDATGCSEEHFTTEKLIDIPQCTQLITPLNNATDVPISSTIQWDASATATGYRISIGTSSGGTDIVNGKDLGNVTSYTPVADFLEGATIYVRIIAYNEAGDATGCSEEHFTTEKLIEIPGCTQLISPLNNAVDVPISSTIQWDASATATGYRISIGTSSGGTDIVSNLDLGNVTSYTHSANFPENTTVYVRVTPYNQTGDATACLEEQFTTKARNESRLLDTQYGISPNGDSINDFWEIQGIENFPDNVVTVFNRWGDMVFQVHGYDNHAVAFYGNANKNTAIGAGALPSGTYFFQIDINSSGNLNTTKGFIVLKR